MNNVRWEGCGIRMMQKVSNSKFRWKGFKQETQPHLGWIWCYCLVVSKMGSRYLLKPTHIGGVGFTLISGHGLRWLDQEVGGYGLESLEPHYTSRSGVLQQSSLQFWKVCQNG
jgi:hypothetical protein